jgi:hypothetical protein
MVFPVDDPVVEPVFVVAGFVGVDCASAKALMARPHRVIVIVFMAIIFYDVLSVPFSGDTENTVPVKTHA